MKHAIVNWVGLVTVGAAAAILTFNTLRSLAEACGFHGWLSWLLPVSVDAAGAVATNVWLAGKDNEQAVRFARAWALTAAGVSLVGNATEHGLAAYGMAAPWWVAVAVAVVPPLALVGTVHLMVLLSKGVPPVRTPGPDVGATDANSRAGVRAADAYLHEVATVDVDDLPVADPIVEQVRAFLVDNPDAGRPTIARELAISEHQARKALGAMNGRVR